MNKRFDDFDKEYNRTKTFILAMWLIQAVIVLAGCGFVGWVVVKVMQFFGVI